jgi:outer membrane protein assembly factor BamD
MFRKTPLVLLVILAVLLTACNRKFMKLQKNGTEMQKYTAAVDYFSQKDYYHAGLLFEEIIPILQGDTAVEKAHIFNAYCQYYEKQYQLASYKFKTFYDTYNRSPYAEEAYYMYAYSLYKDSPRYNLDQTSTSSAIDAMQNFINEYPSSKFVEQGTASIIDLRQKLELKAYERAKLYFSTSGVSIANYKAAVVAINNFAREYPDSKFNEELAFIKVQSQHDLAKVSFESKQKERFTDVLKYYEEFVDLYPQSTYLKQAEKLYTFAQTELERILKLEKDEKISANK